MAADGIAMGIFPMRDIACVLADGAEHLAADVLVAAFAITALGAPAAAAGPSKTRLIIVPRLHERLVLDALLGWFTRP